MKINQESRVDLRELLMNCIDAVLTNRILWLTIMGNRKNTGLGLSICQFIAESHQGTITITSVPGEGAVFFVNLPTG